MRNQPKHLVAFVFHDQVNDIIALLDMIDGYTASIG